MSRLRTIAVFCGSNDGNNPAFAKAAQELGHLFLKRNISLMYGGGSKGLMGVISRTIHNNGGRVEGVIPELFIEACKPLIGETVIVQDMHTRKKMIYEKADAFIALPGGIGTLEEIVEITSWSKLGLHNKPIGMLNTENFYAGILDWFSTAFKEEFVTPEDTNIINVSDNCEELLDLLESKLHSAEETVTTIGNVL